MRHGGLSRRIRRLTAQTERLEREPPARRVLPLADWLPRVSPEYRWDWPHLAMIRRHLERVASGEISRLMIFCPPRHGKSSLTTLRFPVWRLEQDPSTRVVMAAYNQTYAEKLSRQARKIARGRVPISRERNSAKQWETPQGGGVRACGVGSPPTGEGAVSLIIDDPTKSRQEADSPAYREKVWEWYSEDLLTRLEPGGSIVLIMTRWHPDDLAGRILASEDASEWTVLSLPALAEENDPLGRKPGEALCPDRYSAAALEKRRRVMGERAFAALFQQNPRPRGGNLFNRVWFGILDAVPIEAAARIRYWDKGYSAQGDWSVGCRMSKSRDGLWTIEHIVRIRGTPAERNRVIRETARADDALFGRRVPVHLEQPPGAGHETTATLIKELAGHVVHAAQPRGEKTERAEPFSSQAEAGNVRLVRGAWNAAFLDELEAFPNGEHDDQVDAASGAFRVLENRRTVNLRC